MQASTDWRGNDVDPGCMPCPNGTFNNQWGRESCFLCDPETQACGVGTVTPLPAHVKPWTWSQTVRTHWKVLKIVDMKLRPLLPFQLPIPPYGRCNPAKESCGKTGGAYTVIESNEENFQFVMLLLSALFTIFLYVCLKAIKYGLPEYWPKVKEIIKKIDKFCLSLFPINIVIFSLCISTCAANVMFIKNNSVYPGYILLSNKSEYAHERHTIHVICFT